MKDPKWVTLCKRTNDPKLAFLEYLLDGEGISTRRRGESFHAPILEVLDTQEDAAWEILGPLDDIPDDDPRFQDGPKLRDDARAENYCDEMGELYRAGLSRGQP